MAKLGTVEPFKTARRVEAMKMRILLDVDGVVCDYERHWRDCAYMAGVAINEKDQRNNSWYMEDRYELSLTERLAIERILYTESPESMHPLPYAAEAVSELLDTFDVFFVTTSLVPNPVWEYGRRRWFDDRFGTEAAKRLVFTRYKHIISGHMFVDDKPRNVHEWSKANAGRAILFGERNGEKADAKDWPQLMRLIKAFAASHVW